MTLRKMATSGLQMRRQFSVSQERVHRTVAGMRRRARNWDWGATLLRKRPETAGCELQCGQGNLFNFKKLPNPFIQGRGFRDHAGEPNPESRTMCSATISRLQRSGAQNASCTVARGDLYEVRERKVLHITKRASFRAKRPRIRLQRENDYGPQTGRGRAWQPKSNLPCFCYERENLTVLARNLGNIPQNHIHILKHSHTHTYRYTYKCIYIQIQIHLHLNLRNKLLLLCVKAGSMRACFCFARLQGPVQRVK